MSSSSSDLATIGLFGLAVMGQNLALNIAEKGFKIAVCNRSPSKVSPPPLWRRPWTPRSCSLPAEKIRIGRYTCIIIRV